MTERLERILREHGPLAAWAAETEKQLKEPAFQRDTRFLKTLLPMMERMNRYFDADVRGFEKVPRKGPMLLIGNHSGGVLTPDTTAFIAAWYRERGLKSPLIGLAFDAVFGIPGFRTIMRKIGQVPASQRNAARALDAGASVLIYPGGDYEVFRPWTERNKIDFAGRKGFIKLALRKGVPVIPVVGHGGHDTTIVLSRGDWLARRLPLDMVRAEIWPVLWQIPWGLSLPVPLGLPLPAKITVEILEPVDWSAYGPRDAEDPEVLERCYEEITGVMQRALDRMAKENPYPVLTRLWGLFGGDGATASRPSKPRKKATTKARRPARGARRTNRPRAAG